MFGRVPIITGLAVFAVGALFIIATGVSGFRFLGDQQGYAPEQPIPFSHKLHAGELGVQCRYCHSGVESSRHAGFPPVETCFGCHKNIRARQKDVRLEEAMAKRDGRPPQDIVSPFIAKIYEALALDSATLQPLPGASPRTIRWVKVHNMGDFVFFDHHRHVQTGFDCVTCHGDVAAMDKITQSSPLTMGWCVNCHRDENEKAKIDRAGMNCANCHY